jgi:hypothetical protein
MGNYLLVIGLVGLCIFGIKENNNRIERNILIFILICIGIYFTGYMIGKFVVHLN